jgi:hypothetical protein
MNDPRTTKNQTQGKLLQRSTGKLYPKQSSQGSEPTLHSTKTLARGLSAEEETKLIPKFSAKHCLQAAVLKDSLVLNPHS